MDMKDFKWQLINFIDGSNSYVCKTEKEFKRMKSKYMLEKIDDNVWNATDSISYSVVGFANKNKMANFHREYKTRQSAMRSVQKLRDNNYESIVLRKEIKYMKNNEYLDISVSTPLCVYE